MCSVTIDNTSKSIAILLSFLILACSITVPPVHAQEQDLTADRIEEVGDYVQVALPLTALISTYIADDPEGRAQFSKSFLSSFLIMQTGKFFVSKFRPNTEGPGMGDDRSFPSGHTTAAFSGASFIYSRYGYKWGIPAYLAAAYVGYSRVYAQKHYADDVIAGAGIAMLCNWYFTTPYSETVQLLPLVARDGYGLMAAIKW